MNFSAVDESLVILNVPPALEETLVDWLLAREEGGGFTSFPAEGHSTRHQGLSIAEQVSGRQARRQFQIQMETQAVDGFLDALQSLLGQAGIHFWVMPIMKSGRFGPGN